MLWLEREKEGIKLSKYMAVLHHENFTLWLWTKLFEVDLATPTNQSFDLRHN